MKMIREPAVAGAFYPADADELSHVVDQFLAASVTHGCQAKALIVPHAGYIYSGAIAASAYASLTPFRATIRRVVILGPSHYVAFSGLAYSDADCFRTPLGCVEQDKIALARICDLAQVQHLEAAHRDEHSLEVQLPFLQRCLSEFSVIPLVVGQASAAEVSEVLERLWGGEETLVVISSDLSHYLSYAQAQASDEVTTQAIERLDTHIDARQACGRTPIIGLLQSAKQHRLNVTTLDLRNSGDTAGDKDRVVGYGAYVLQ